MRKWHWITKLKEIALSGLVGLASNPKVRFEIVTLGFSLPQPNQILSDNKTNNGDDDNEASLPFNKSTKLGVGEESCRRKEEYLLIPKKRGYIGGQRIQNMKRS